MVLYEQVVINYNFSVEAFYYLFQYRVHSLTNFLK